MKAIIHQKEDSFLSHSLSLSLSYETWVFFAEKVNHRSLVLCPNFTSLWYMTFQWAFSWHLEEKTTRRQIILLILDGSLNNWKQKRLLDRRLIPYKSTDVITLSYRISVKTVWPHFVTSINLFLYGCFLTFLTCLRLFTCEPQSNCRCSNQFFSFHFSFFHNNDDGHDVVGIISGLVSLLSISPKCIFAGFLLMWMKINSFIDVSLSTRVNYSYLTDWKVCA